MPRDHEPTTHRESTADATLVVRRNTRWQRVEILRHPVFGHQLVIDGDLQISEADRAYNTAMTAPVLTRTPCRRVAILGGGDGGVLHELLTAADRLGRELEQVTLIDIDDEVMSLCRQWLPRLCGDAFDDPRAEVIAGDAFAWLDRARDLDAVIYDLTLDPVREGQDRNTFISDTLAKIGEALRPGGMLTMQACGEWLGEREALLANLRERLRDGFEEAEEQTVVVPSYGEKWTFISACRRE